MNRRSFLQVSAASASCVTVSASSGVSSAGRDGFRLKYAPHPGMFRHHAGEDVLDQIRFAADEGFRAWEDNGMAGRPADEQAAIGALLADKGMEMGVFVAHAEWKKASMSFVSGTDEARDRIAGDMRRAVDVAERCGAKFCTVVPGPRRPDVQSDYQTAQVVENLRRAVAALGDTDLTLVLEPLNPWRDHPGMFLTTIPQAYLVCRAVGETRCKILDDLYHQQVTEGNLIPNLDAAWSEIAYVQIGDNPGRREPGTGEIHYGNVFRHLHRRGFDGILGMEHGNSLQGKAGERAVIDAYRKADQF